MEDPSDIDGNARYLYRIIEAIGSGPDLDTILRGVIQLVTDATGCQGCFVFFLHGEELVLHAASGIYSHLAGQVRLSIDEGLVGWAARTGRSTSIADRALDDPRVLFVPELHQGERFQSMIAVPIISRTGTTVGVIGMNTRAPREFEPHEVEFVERAASLVGGAMESARLGEEATTRVALLTVLSSMAQQIAAATSTEELLPLVVRGCRGLLAADRCELYLRARGGGERLLLQAASPTRSQGRHLTLGDLELALMGTTAGQLDAPRSLASLLWGPRARGVSLCAPLVVGAERLGLLCVLLPHPTSDSQSVLAAIASHAAVAVKRHQQIDSLTERNLVSDFFEALAGGQASEGLLRMQAVGLQCDLAAAHLVLHAIPWASSTGSERRQRAWWSAVGRLQSALRSQLAGSVFDRRDASVRALLRIPPTGPEAVVSQVRRLHAEVAGGDAGPVAVGLSNVSQGAASYARRFSEAESAVQVGPLLEGSAGVYTYEGLCAYRYALSAADAVRDRHQECVERLFDYGRTRATDLVGTLDTYLELRGNIARAARQLDVHPNTLRQRLARIEQITELKVDTADWVSLAMAIKTVKVRALRSTWT